MNLDLKTNLVAVPVPVHVLIVKVVTGYWVQTDLNPYMRNHNIGTMQTFFTSNLWILFD